MVLLLNPHSFVHFHEIADGYAVEIFGDDFVKVCPYG